MTAQNDSNPVCYAFGDNRGSRFGSLNGKRQSFFLWEGGPENSKRNVLFVCVGIGAAAGAVGDGRVGGPAHHGRQRPGPTRGGCASLAFSIVNRVCMAVLYWHAGCSTAKNGGLRPRQGTGTCFTRGRRTTSVGASAPLGFDHIVVSEIEALNLFVNLV
jgi:hypothetical protein